MKEYSKFTIKYLEEISSYIKSPEAQRISKENLIRQVVEYLNNKYPQNTITVNLEKEIFTIKGGNKELIVSELKSIGLCS